MASGRINRNVYPPSLIPGLEGCWRVLTRVESKHHCMVFVVSGLPSDLDDTELPRLTSDFLLRRSAGGEILIFADQIILFERV